MAVEIEIVGDSSNLLKDVRQLTDGMEDLNKETQELGDSYKETFSKSSKSIDKTTKALAGQVKATDKLDKNIDGVKKSFVQLDKAKDKAFDDQKIVDLNKELDKTDKKVDEIKKSANSGVLDGLKEGAGELKEGFGEIAEGLSGGPSGVGGALTSIVGKLGPIGVGIGVAVGIAGALGSEIIAINGEFDALRGKVALLTGETGDSADAIVITIKALSETFDEDVNESLQAVNVLMKEFGISGQEATALLEKGFLSNANIQGDLIDGVKEYSSQIRASGGSADDLFAILDKSGQEGIFSDKGIDVVKEFGLRIREQTTATSDAMENAFGKPFADRIAKGVSDGSISSIEALKLVSGELGTLDESSKEAQTVLADVFGGAGEDAGFRFLTQLKDINTEQGFQIDGTNALVQAQQKNLNAQKELAGAQNELSKAIGDTSGIGRVWVQLQTVLIGLLVDTVTWIDKIIRGFELLSTDPIAGLTLLADAIFEKILSPLNKVIDLVNALADSFGFDSAIDNIDLIADATKELTESERKHLQIVKLSIDAQREYGDEARKRIGILNEEIDVLKDSNASEEEKAEVIKKLNAEYPELLGNIDLQNASTEELEQLNKKLTVSILEQEIARKRGIAVSFLQLEIDKRVTELQTTSSEARKKQLNDEIEFLQTKGFERIDLVEEETRIQLGLLERKTEETETIEEDSQSTRTSNAQKGANDRLKIEEDFNKSVQELLKKGQNAFLNDQLVSKEERLKRKRDFQQEELNGLLDHIKQQNEILNGGQALDSEIIDAFNQAQEAIEVEYQNSLLAIKKKAIDEQKKLTLKNRSELLGIDKESADIRKAFLISNEKEELALVEQLVKEKGESERQFEIRKEQEVLEIKSFYLDQKADLIDQETQLKLDALDIELLAIADKEGLEFELKRQNLEAKKDLIKQETSQQKEEYQVQKNDFQEQIDGLAGTDRKRLQDSLDNIKDSIASALNIDTEQLGAITDAVVEVGKQVFDTINENLSNQLDAQNEIIDNLSQRGDRVSEELDREIELNKLGFASNVDLKRQELENIRKQEEKAQKEREVILEKQRQMDEISQLSSLITSSANIFKSLSSIPFVGVPLAIGLIATMFGAYASTKAQASQLTKLEKGGSGDSTGMFVGNRHTSGGESFLEHVEVEDGEKWGVLNRGASSKYGMKFDDVIKAMNEGTFDDFDKEIIIDKEVPNLIIQRNQSLISERIQLDAEILSEKMSIDLKKLHSIDAILKKQYNKPVISTFKDSKGQNIRQTIESNGSVKYVIINE